MTFMLPLAAVFSASLHSFVPADAHSNADVNATRMLPAPGVPTASYDRLANGKRSKVRRGASGATTGWQICPGGSFCTGVRCSTNTLNASAPRDRWDPQQVRQSYIPPTPT